MKNKTGIILLGIVIFLYGILFYFTPNLAMKASKESYQVLKFVMPVFMIVVILMVLISAFIDENTFSKHMGEESGLKGWLIALIGGILSHGPSYIWYPLLQNMREKGVKDSLIITFLYARSIKLPWLPMMISYFGMKFTVVFTFYIVLASIAQGVIVELKVKE